MRIDHRLVMELVRENGDTVGHAALEPDWHPAMEWTRLASLRAHNGWPPAAHVARIEPLWHHGRGEPYMRAFRVHLANGGGASWYHDFSIRYFASLARSAAAQLVAKGTLTSGETFLYRALAYQKDCDAEQPDSTSFRAIDQSPPLIVRTTPREALINTSAPGGDTCADDFEVFLPQDVLDEASALTQRAGDLETGGILIGHIARDTDGTDVFVEVTALIPARHTVGTTTKLTFTSDTWTDVRQAVTLRARDETVLGWFHSHPQHAWCRDKGCTLEDQHRCASATGFFSSDDAVLHRTVFPRAFSVALLMTQSVQGILPRLFGWRAGVIEPRGYRVLTHANQALCP